MLSFDKRYVCCGRARDSNHACRWLESMWVTICPSPHLITPIITPGDDLQFYEQIRDASPGQHFAFLVWPPVYLPSTGPWKSPSRTPRGVNGARRCTAFAKAA